MLLLGLLPPPPPPPPSSLYNAGALVVRSGAQRELPLSSALGRQKQEEGTYIHNLNELTAGNAKVH